jgi:hypothetical protein
MLEDGVTKEVLFDLVRLLQRKQQPDREAKKRQIVAVPVQESGLALHELCHFV